MTIMALALRTAESIDARLNRMADLHPRSEGAKSAQLTFEETMSGTLRLEHDKATTRPLSIALNVAGRGRWDLLRAEKLALTGHVLAEGFGTRCPLEGALVVDVLRRGTMTYDLVFTADDGHRYRFKGKKRVRLGALRKSMTTLRARIFDDADQVVAKATVTFDLERDLVDFLRSFRVS
jgi:hypothetical protein